MPTYKDICRQAENLTPDEQLRLLEKLVAIVRRRTTPKPEPNIMELEGLGKEIWQGIDAQECTSIRNGLRGMANPAPG